MNTLPSLVLALLGALFADEGDDNRLFCGDCEQKEKISLSACLAGRRTAPTEESVHRFVLDQDGRKTQVLIGLRDKGSSQQAYFAHRPDGTGDWQCAPVAVLDAFAVPNAVMNSVGLAGGAPGVAITLFAQDSCTSQSQDYGIACPALGEGCELAVQGKYSESPRGECADEDNVLPEDRKKARQKAAAEKKTRARAEKLHTQGMTAFKKGDLAAAEQAWKAAALDSIAALNDLGFLYQQQKRYPEAERALLETLLRDEGRLPAWLNIADLYWDAGKKGLARRAYAEYARSAKLQAKKGPIPPRVSERSQ